MPKDTPSLLLSTLMTGMASFRAMEAQIVCNQPPLLLLGATSIANIELAR